MTIKRYQKNILISSVVIGILFGASCLKKQNLEEDNLGSMVAPEEIATALGDAYGDVDYSAMKINEVADIIISQRIQDGVQQNLEQQEITLKEINNEPSYLQIKSHVSMTTFSSSGNITDVRDWDQIFPKYSGFAFSMNQQRAQQTEVGDLNEPIFTFKLIQGLALGSCYDGGSYPESCHNLSVTDIQYKVPAASAHQHSHCADIYNCFIAAKKIEFDLLQKYNLDEDGKPRRVHYNLVISREVPFTSRILEYCTRSLYQITGVEQKVLADICYKINRYSFGQ